MTRQALLAGVLSVTLSGLVACDRTSTAPSNPLTPPVDLQRLELVVEGPRAISQSPWGAALIVEPGETVQVRARVYLQDGSGRDVTNQATWGVSGDLSNNTIGAALEVRSGLVKAPTCVYDPNCPSMGIWNVGATYGSEHAQQTVLVMRGGTFAVRGYVTEATSGRQVSNALVEVEYSPGFFGHLTRTGDDGRFRAIGLPSGVQWRVTRGDDYVPTIERVLLTSHQSQVEFSLAESPSWARLEGLYRLTLTADADCSTRMGDTTRAPIPPELRVRTYQALVEQTGNSLGVTLSGARFATSLGSELNSFLGRLSRDSATFSLTRDEEGCGEVTLVVEELSPDRFLYVGGKATVSPTTLSGTLDGTWVLNDQNVVAACVSSGHQFRLTR